SSGSNENINLPPKYRYHYLDDYLTFHSFIIKEKRIKFEVMGCNDAHLILSESRTDSVNAYEIVIGGWKNNQSVIRIDKQGQAMANASHSPLSCNTFKPFWVSWENGTIETGEGKEIGNGKFMKWTDPKPHTVNFIGISSWHTAEAHWKFNKDPYNATFWLGGTDLEHSRHYTNWLPDEPKYPITDGHCIHLSLDRDFRWATDNCTLKRNFICELDTSLVSTNADSG
ncbi:C3 and PZP-like alpha-2-macroglobulin domain-containing protein 8, partial [Saccostrea cucullata]|uniref:C3 and PZP-like alpha-2-macroglobulin domain-containing protein 8 n=1 Tax=Saccostrea cuccullata TaxID=36930 RepID=UPI002ED53103